MICLLPLIFFSCIAPLTVTAQTGVITGRVVNEEGAGMPNVTVYLNAVATDRRPTQGAAMNRTATDIDGNFKFTGVAPRVYSVGAISVKGYVPRTIPFSEIQDGGYHRIGANVTITMMKGGAISGKVSNSTGEPLIGVPIAATMTRDADGNPVRGDTVRPRFTDDRGLYRIYGLSPGTYVVSTRNTNTGSYPSPYDLDAPTYHPSGPRETAAEVTVASGGETGGVDIRYRGDTGHVISGSVTGAGEPSSPYSGIIVTLSSATTGAILGNTNVVRSSDGAVGFALYGVIDGEYEIAARNSVYLSEQVFTSAPRRIGVKGADVGGIELKLLPMASIAGKFTLEASPGACESKRKWSLEEALLALRNETTSEGAVSARNQVINNGLTEKGEFTVYNLEANRYFLEPRLPNENWYVKSITGPASTAAPARGAGTRGAPASDVARNGIALKAGEKFSGVTVTIADGAAGVSGKVIPATEGSRLPARLRIHLVPAESTAANEVLRYAEVFARSNGSFLFSNITPGKYWLIARAAPDDEMTYRTPAPVAWDANARAKLRKEAEAMKIELDLKPCQRVSDQVVKYQ
ncbi:MAG TPA: carboxypeptidase-like regulatory domain-containing protein [Blastocatellia bacterium]|nr:carboxypeptidase-like regulatory domain-containing protein [Blastocatellia bacterium]